MEVRAPRIAPSERAPADFYFLVDRSGSMQGEKWAKAAEALQSCVRVLGATDRVMVTFFETSFQDFAEGPLAAQDLLRDPRFQTIQSLGAAGGTEMKSALAHVLEIAARNSSGRVKNLILITDAQVGNESAILEIMKSAPDLPVHCFGVDIALNDALLLALCRQQGGTFHSLHPKDDIQNAVSSLGRTLGCPVLLDLKLSEGWELADATIPNLYAGQIHFLSARSTNGNPLKLVARTTGSENVSMQFEAQPMAGEAPYLHWCRSRIQRLIAEGDKQTAIALSVRSNLICPLTAFIAWDESEKVSVASHGLIQPSMALAEEGFPAMPVGRSAHVGTFPVVRKGLFFRCESDRSSILMNGGDPDELTLSSELSEICHRIGVSDWQALLKAIFDWIGEAQGAERSQRIGAVSDLFREIRWPEHFSSPSVDATAVPKIRIQTALQSFIKKHQIRTEVPL
jgi:Ca-activated chloride channel family protein